MSSFASSSPSRDPSYGKTKHPKSRKPHWSDNRTGPSKAYPKGVSSYLSTFLNDEGDHSNADDGSGSDSDDSFFSYSARFASPDLNHSHLRRQGGSSGQQLSRPSSAASINSHHSISSVTAPRSFHDNPEYQLLSPHIPLLSGHRDTSSGQKHHKKVSSLEKESPELIAVVAHKRASLHGRYPGRSPRKSARSTHSFPTKSELIASMDSSRLKEKTPLPKLCDAAVQTSPQEYTPGPGICKRCQGSMVAPDNDISFLLEANPNSTAKSSASDVSDPQVTVGSQMPASGESSNPASVLGSTLLSDGNKTDSFASSDALPDDIVRLFDRASFSIHGGPTSSSSSSIDDPDGLRKGLRALLKRPESLQNQSAPLSSPPMSPTGPGAAELSAWMDKFTSNPPFGHAPIASISGVMFADPFATSVGQSAAPVSDSTRTKYSKSRTISLQRRKSSVSNLGDPVPPVPVIPDNFRRGSITRASVIPRPASLARPSSLGNGSGLSEIIHPHSPVQVSSRFSPTTGRRISLRPHQDFLFTEPPNACRRSRGSASADSTIGRVKSGSDSRIQVSHLFDYSDYRKPPFHMHVSENFAPVSIPTIRRPSLWDKIVNSSATPTSSGNSSPQPPAGTSKSSQAKTRRKLQRKTQPQALKV